MVHFPPNHPFSVFDMPLSIKRGATFDAAGTLEVSDGGAPVTSMVGWQGSSQLRTMQGTLIADLQFTWLNQTARQIRLRQPNTAQWPVGQARLDIRLVTPTGDVLFTPTDTVTIQRSETGA